MRRRPVDRPEYRTAAFDLDSIEVVRGGDGRTVRAYAATFDHAYEVRDQRGHYFETISRSAYDRAISHGTITRAVCLFNHGMTVYNTPSEKWSVPLGTPLEITPDAKGLLTVTRYLKTDSADEILEAVRGGAITSQSFRGPIYNMANPRQHRSGLNLVELTELGLKDYGPTPFPVNDGAQILSVRSLGLIADEIREMTPDERAQLLAELAGSDTPEDRDPSDEEDTHEAPPAAEVEAAPEPAGPSLELIELEQAQRKRRLNQKETGNHA